MTVTNPKRRWLRFSLRTMFMLVTIAGVVAGWAAYQLNWIRQRHEFANRYGEMPTSWRSDLHPPGAPWQLRLFGECRFSGIAAPESQAVHARELFPEAAIYCHSDDQESLPADCRTYTAHNPPILQY